MSPSHSPATPQAVPDLGLWLTTLTLAYAVLPCILKLGALGLVMRLPDAHLESKGPADPAQAGG